MSILVLAEHDSGTFSPTATELLGKGSQLAAALGTHVDAVVLGEVPASQLGAVGAKTVFQVRGDFSTYSTTRVVAALQAALARSGASALLAPASFIGKDAIPRLVARLQTGQASECTGLRVDGGQIVATRPIFAGKAYCDVRISKVPAVFTVRPNSFDRPAATTGTAAIVPVDVDLGEHGVRVLETRAPQANVVDVTTASRIVSGGRSLKSKENFDSVIRPLAAALSAATGATRAAVDAGFAPHGEQIGQTGKTVNPQLYVAAGISGAIQHLSGMRTSRIIVAINTDEAAPIFEYATYGLVADLFEVCPKLQAAVKRLE